MAKGDLHQGEAVFGRDAHAFGQDLELGLGGDAVIAQHRIDETLIGRIDGLRAAPVVRERADCRIDHLGHQHIDAIGRAIDMGIDPVELLLELFGGKAGGAEDAEAARLADRGDDIAAVAEGEQREFGAGQGANAVHGHGCLLFRGHPMPKPVRCKRCLARCPHCAMSLAAGCQRASGGNTSSSVPSCHAP